MIPMAVDWATVPEAPIDEDGDSRTWEDDISLAAQAGKRIPVNEVPKTQPPHRTAENQFRSRVVGPLLLHPPPNRGR